MDTAFRPSLAPILVAAGLLCCGVAQAQVVRKCMLNGQPVYQSAPCMQELRPGAAAAPLAAATSNAVAGKKKTLADLLRERDGDPRDRPSPGEAQGDGANILRSRMGAS
jgi:hypothetical protein